MVAAVVTHVQFFGKDRAGHTASVFAHGTQTLASLFATDGVTPISNPTTVSNQGNITFAVVPGTYDVVDTGDGAKVVVVVTAPGTGPVSALASLSDVAVSGVADGQLLAYQASTGKFVPVTPTGVAELAYSENATGTLTGPVAAAIGAFAASAIAIPNTDISVPNSGGRPVYIDACVMGQQMTGTTGLAVVELWETTGGTNTFITRSNGVQLPNNTSATALRNLDVRLSPYRLGVVTTTRTFNLRINAMGNGSGVTWQAANLNAVGFKSWLRAMTA